ncbi:uncharacterized protein LOC116131965 [Pistacia vera]|uniref:uncharacterized protein LOC116131965 n=1 Tax=Pistacia vera TaxID=55513 RepID=UPI0012630026|nr:uncharacterized protein LOC116131965 [Pistacia vera]
MLSQDNQKCSCTSRPHIAIPAVHASLMKVFSITRDSILQMSIESVCSSLHTAKLSWISDVGCGAVGQIPSSCAGGTVQVEVDMELLSCIRDLLSMLFVIELKILVAWKTRKILRQCLFGWLPE